MKVKIFTLLTFLVILSVEGFGQKVDATMYNYDHSKVYLPQGEISFADQVVSSKRMVKGENIHKSLHDPAKTLGTFDYKPGGYAAYTLGCGGEIVVKFIDNALIDIKGIDLYIYEVGTTEPTQLSISKDGETWIVVGKIKEGQKGVDIGPFVKPDDEFSYVKLVDLNECTEINPGADIDAIAAIGTVKVEKDDKKEDKEKKEEPIEKEVVVETPKTPIPPKTPEPVIAPPKEVEGREVEVTQTLLVSKKDLILEVWDRREEDGDRISLIINGDKYVLKNHKVRKKKKSFPLKLDGDSYLTLHALNLGDTPPNTAAISFDDGVQVQKIELSSDMGKSETILIKVQE